jgi:putative flippase GtrA
MLMYGRSSRYQPPIRAERFIRYCAVGGVNTITDLTAFVLLITTLKVAPAHANVVSYAIALCGSFVLNKRFTFQFSAYLLAPTAQFFRFVVLNSVTLAGSTIAVWLLSAAITPVAAKLAVTPFVTAWGFLVTRHIVFAPNE